MTESSSAPPGLTVPEASELAVRVLTEVDRAVVGKRTPLTLVLAAILAKGHVLLEDFPGLGKTLAARSLRAGAGAGVLARAVHPRPAAGRPHRLLPLQPARGRPSSSAAARCSPGCCWPTRSTARRPRRSRRCSRRCRSAR